MECIHFKGRMVRGTAPFNLDRKGYHVAWDAQGRHDHRCFINASPAASVMFSSAA